MNTTKTMITDEQRKAFADLIKDAERRFESNFGDDFKKLKSDLSPRLEARSRAKQLMENVRSLKGKLAESMTGLRRLGYHVDDGIIAIDYDLDGNARRDYEEVLESAIEERDKRLTKFRKAVVDVWTTNDFDDARRIVSEVV
jgi:hypothetical protein